MRRLSGDRRAIRRQQCHRRCLGVQRHPSHPGQQGLTPKHVARPVPKGSLTKVRNRVPHKNPLQLVRQFGAQMLSDGAGNPDHRLWPSPYQGAADYSMARGEDAHLVAQQAIMSFVSERVVKSANQRKIKSCAHSKMVLQISNKSAKPC